MSETIILFKISFPNFVKVTLENCKAYEVAATLRRGDLELNMDIFHFHGTDRIYIGKWYILKRNCLLCLNRLSVNPQTPVAQKVADEVVFRRFQVEGVVIFKLNLNDLPPQIFDAHLLENTNLSPSSFYF